MFACVWCVFYELLKDVNELLNALYGYNFKALFSFNAIHSFYVNVTVQLISKYKLVKQQCIIIIDIIPGTTVKGDSEGGGGYKFKKIK